MIENGTSSNVTSSFYVYDEHSDQFLEIDIPNYRGLSSNKETNSLFIYEHGSAATGAQFHYIWKDTTTYVPYTYFDADYDFETDVMDYSLYSCNKRANESDTEHVLICHNLFSDADPKNNPCYNAYWNMSYSILPWNDIINGYTCYYGYDGENEYLFVVTDEKDLIDEVKSVCNKPSQFQNASITQNNNGEIQMTVTYTDKRTKLFVSDLKF